MQGQLITPAPTENILLDSIYHTVMELALHGLGMRTCEPQIDHTELHFADKIFQRGTGAQLAPSVEVDHCPIGSGNAGPVSNQLQQLYFDMVRNKDRPHREQWCSPIFTHITGN
jgi:branched-chain amino acid aminotransferase